MQSALLSICSRFTGRGQSFTGSNPLRPIGDDDTPQSCEDIKDAKPAMKKENPRSAKQVRRAEGRYQTQDLMVTFSRLNASTR